MGLVAGWKVSALLVERSNTDRIAGRPIGTAVDRAETSGLRLAAFPLRSGRALDRLPGGRRPRSQATVHRAGPRDVGDRPREVGRRYGFGLIRAHSPLGSGWQLALLCLLPGWLRVPLAATARARYQTTAR